MTSFDLDLSGDELLGAKLRELEERGDGEPVWNVGVGAEYAVFLEFGTRHMPPYPYFRPALREFKANPEAFIAKNTGTTLAEIDTTEDLVESVALALERQIKINATAQAGGRSPGVNPDHPSVQTGNLRASISAQRLK